MVNSVKPYEEIIKSPLNMPVHFTLQNFVEAFETSDMLNIYGNSILITASSVLLLVMLTSMAAYIIARLKSWVYQSLYVFPLAGIMIPPWYADPQHQDAQRAAPALHHARPVTVLCGHVFQHDHFSLSGLYQDHTRQPGRVGLYGRGKPFNNVFHIIFPLIKPCTATAVIILGMWR